jgi:hypothetical protein
VGAGRHENAALVGGGVEENPQMPFRANATTWQASGLAARWLDQIDRNEVE